MRNGRRLIAQLIAGIIIKGAKELTMEYKEKVEHYFNKFEEAGLYKRAEFEDDEFASHLYFHYQNIVDDCAGLIEDPEDLMCWSCRKWYDYIVETTAKKHYRDRMGGIEKKHLDYLTELVKQKGVDDE